jgi:hypothetical protein
MIPGRRLGLRGPTVQLDDDNDDRVWCAPSYDRVTPVTIASVTITATRTGHL